jgi:hypothetical protein
MDHVLAQMIEAYEAGEGNLPNFDLAPENREEEELPLEELNELMMDSIEPHSPRPV